MFRWFAGLRVAIRSMLCRKRVEQELDEEFQYHLERQIHEELRRGLAPKDARYAAMRAMGPMTRSIEECRDARRVNFIEDLLRDLRYAGRALLRNRGFAAVVLTTLAIAIGSVVTVFSIVDAWLLRPLNFPEPDRLVIAFAARPERPAEPAVWLPYRAYAGWKERSRSFESVSGAFRRGVTLTTANDAQSLVGMNVTPEFFRTFGVGALLGRTLSEEDVTGPRTIVLSYGLWQRQFGGATDVIGKAVTLSGIPYQIVGIMPRDFDTRMLDMRFDFWSSLIPGKGGYTSDGLGPVTVIGRLRNGISIDAARSEVATLTREIETGHTINFNQFVVTLTSLQADNARTVRATLLTISGAVVSLLLIASMNVGTLLLGRGLVRIREAAIRTAVGSGRGRLIRQFLTESLLLAALGGAAGLGLAAIAIRMFVAWAPPGALPANAIQLDIRVLGATFIATALTTVLCGLMPALRIANTNPYDALRTGGERGPAGIPGQRAQGTLLVAQIAVCVLLLVATTLLLRTFLRLQSEPLGFDPTNLMVANIVLPDDPFDSSEERNIFYTQLDGRIRALPGVRAVAAGTSVPLISAAPSTVHTTPENSADDPRISTQDVTTEFFDTLTIPLRAGRVFDARDSRDGSPKVILNARAAEQLFGNAAAALGRHVRLDDEPWREVIGVVGNVRSTFFNTLEWQTDPVVYRPAAQGFRTLSNPTATTFGFTLHIRSDRPLTMADVRAAAAKVNPKAAVTQLQTVSDIVEDATRQPALRMTLLLAFAAISVLLAAIGVYGLVAQAVVQQRREVAIRIAMGARSSEVIAAVSRRALTVTVVGFALGIAGAFMAGQVLEALLYGVRPRDAASFVTAGVVLLAAAIVAAVIPALRATRVDPATLLRGE
jgi:predicted permease